MFCGDGKSKQSAAISFYAFPFSTGKHSIQILIAFFHYLTKNSFSEDNLRIEEFTKP